MGPADQTKQPPQQAKAQAHEREKKMNKLFLLFRQIFCFHLSWAKAGWKVYSAMRNENWYVCKECGKEKNFGFRKYDFVALPEFPVNFDCSDDIWSFNKVKYGPR